MKVMASAQPGVLGQAPATAARGTARSPIFIVGSGRSGTTLTASILNGHSALATGPETGFFRTFPRSADRILKDPAWPDQAVQFLMSLTRLTGNVVANYGMDEAQLRAALEGRPRTPRAMLDAILGTNAARNGAQRWVEQTPTHILNVRDIRREWSDAPIIRLLRDPRGVAASYLNVPFGPGTAVGAAALWQLHDDAARATLDDDPNALIVRYEELLADPQREVMKICAWIGEAFEPGMLGSPSTSANSAPPRPSWLTSVVIDGSRADAWQHELSMTDQERVALIGGVGMERHGYPGARRARRTVAVQPYDEHLSTARELLEQAADAGIAFRPPTAEMRADRQEPVLFWGRRRRLRWTDTPVGSETRSLVGWARFIAGARVQKRPLLWVPAATPRPKRDTLGERLGDTLARVAIPHGKQADALARIAPATGAKPDLDAPAGA